MSAFLPSPQSSPGEFPLLPRQAAIFNLITTISCKTIELAEAIYKKSRNLLDCFPLQEIKVHNSSLIFEYWTFVFGYIYK